MPRIQWWIFAALLATSLYTLSHLGVFERVGHDVEEALEELDLDEGVEVVLLDARGHRVGPSKTGPTHVHKRDEHYLEREGDSEHKSEQRDHGHEEEHTKHDDHGVRAGAEHTEEDKEEEKEEEEGTQQHNEADTDVDDEKEAPDTDTGDKEEEAEEAEGRGQSEGEQEGEEPGTAHREEEGEHDKETEGDEGEHSHKQHEDDKGHRGQEEGEEHEHKARDMDEPEKVGAGLLFISGDNAANMQVLLLRRRSKHNHNTWGLAGGNRDEEDGNDLMKTALREGVEELGQLPASYTQVGTMLTKRGKRGQKHYTVFVLRVSEAVRAGYRPLLDPHEHSEWRWFKLGDIQQRHAAAAGVLRGGAGGAVSVLPAEVQAMELHPVVEKVLEQAGGQLLQKLGLL